jgi:hypothetical protein
MPRILAVALALLLIVPPVAVGQSCKLASRTKAKRTAKSKKARANENEAKAAAQLDKAKSLLNTGKRDLTLGKANKLVVYLSLGLRRPGKGSK